MRPEMKRKTVVESNGMSIPTGPFENIAMKTHTGKSHRSTRLVVMSVYMRQNDRRASTMKSVMSISMRNVTARPRNSPPVRSTMEPERRGAGLSSLHVQRSMTSAVSNAGMSENSDSSHIRCLPAIIRQSMTIQRYSGGLSAYGTPWFVKVKKLCERRASSAMLR